jgi:peptidoglycan/xylan/chitin deacetylase (PgdA/CDA1 family)
MAERSWESLFLTSTLAKAGVNVVALVVQREPTDGVALSLGRWKQARKQLGWRRSIRAFFGMPLGAKYYLRRLADRSSYPLLRDVRALGVPVERVEAFNSPAGHDALRRLRPDVTVICGTPILPESLLSIAQTCTVNIHTSLLPHYRGGGSLFWPLFFRDTDKVGFTIHRAVAALDAGPFLYQEHVPVTPGDTPGTLTKKCFRAAAPRLASILTNDPLDEGSWHRYEKPVAHVHRRPHPEVQRYLFGSPAVRWARGVARRTLNGVRRVSGGNRPVGGRHAAFFFHRALPDDTPPTDWRRVLGHPTVSELREKLLFLKRRFRLVSLSQWLARLESCDPHPEPCAVVTVDDGYQDFRTGLLPLLEELGVPAAFFVCSGAVATGTVWYQRVYNLIHQARGDRLVVPWMDTRVHFGDVRHRVLTVERVLLAHLKRLPRDRRHELLNRLVEENNIPPDLSAADAFCDVDDLRAVKQSPLVELYPHSHDHDPFETLTREELHSDFVTCRRFFAETLGLESRVMSYPNGHFKEDQRELLSSLGVRYALTTDNGFEESGKVDNLAIRRNGFGNEPLAVFTLGLRRSNVLR